MGSPYRVAVAAFFAEIVLVIVLMQGLLPLWLFAMTPLHASASEAMGPQPAMFAVALVNVCVAYLIGFLLTIPAVTGLKFGKIQINKEASLRDIMKSMPLVGFNACISVAFGSVGALYLSEGEVLRDLSKNIPSHGIIALQSALFLVAEEVVFYHVHRIFHQNKFLYATVHKIHHTWPAPVAIVSSFAHPIEHIFCNMASIMVGPLLCDAHPAVMLSFTFLFAVGAHVHHCGYWSDDLGMHDLHHEAFNVNFGNAHILDVMYGTYREQRNLKSTEKR